MTKLSAMERGMIATWLTDLMREDSATFECARAAEMIALVPMSLMVRKDPFVGRPTPKEDVQGYAPGIGHVGVPDSPKTQFEIDKSRPSELRFGFWDMGHSKVSNEGLLFIDHIWSHHRHSAYARKSAFLFYKHDGDGVIRPIVLIEVIGGDDLIACRKAGDGVEASEIESSLESLRARMRARMRASGTVRFHVWVSCISIVIACLAIIWVGGVITIVVAGWVMILVGLIFFNLSMRMLLGWRLTWPGIAALSFLVTVLGTIYAGT